MNVIVSAYFKIPSKKPHSEYIEYMKRWFCAVQCPVIFFTTEDVKREIEDMGYNIPHVQFQLMKFEELHAWRLGRDFWERQKQRDVESYHTPELAAIWYEKKEFVKRAMELSSADVFIWCDAGCVRNDNSETALQQFGNRQVWNDDRIHLQHIRDQPHKEFYTFPDSMVAGAIIVGNRTAWTQFSELYDQVLQIYDTNGVCCNSDQYIMASCYDSFPSLFSVHKPTNSIVESWFFFLNVI